MGCEGQNETGDFASETFRFVCEIEGRLGLRGERSTLGELGLVPAVRVFGRHAGLIF